jgi:hypothetical protein
LSPRSKMLIGNIDYFCRGTELRVWFDSMPKKSRLIDERFLEPIGDQL